MRKEDIKREFLTILFAQKRMIIGFTVLTVLLSVAVAYLWPPTYSATGSILMKEKDAERNPIALEVVDRQTNRFELTEQDLSSEVEILTSFDLILRTVKDLQNNPSYLSFSRQNATVVGKAIEGFQEFKERLFSEREFHSSGALEKEAYRIKSNLSIKIIPASNVIHVSFFHKDPQMAVLILESLFDHYMDFRNEVRNTGKQEFFAQQANRFQEHLEKKNDEFLKVIETHGVANPEKDMDNNQFVKGTLDKELKALETVVAEKKALIRNLEGALKDKNNQFFLFINDFTMNTVAKKIQELTMERVGLLRKYTEEYTKITLIDHEIDEAYKNLRSVVSSYISYQEGELRIIQEKIEDMKTRVKGIDTANIQLQRQIVAMDKIRQEIGLLKFSYETFYKRREESKIGDQGNPATSPVSILSKAFPSDGPVYPKKGVVIPFGLLAGILVGLSLGFVREYFDHTIKGPEDVQRALSLPVIFSIPRNP